jgi:hypothetical protein
MKELRGGAVSHLRNANNATKRLRSVLSTDLKQLVANGCCGVYPATSKEVQALVKVKAQCSPKEVTVLGGKCLTNEGVNMKISLYQDVLSQEERAMVLWKMADAIYCTWATDHTSDKPIFGALSIAERQKWIACARSAARAFMGFDGAEPPPPIEGV